MAVVKNLTDIEPPVLGKRYWMVNEWALAAESELTLAVVTRSEFIDPQRVGVLIAEQIGFTANAFESERDALVWLQEPEPE